MAMRVNDPLLASLPTFNGTTKPVAAKAIAFLQRLEDSRPGDLEDADFIGRILALLQGEAADWWSQENSNASPHDTVNVADARRQYPVFKPYFLKRWADAADHGQYSGDYKTVVHEPGQDLRAYFGNVYTLVKAKCARENEAFGRQANINTGAGVMAIWRMRRADAADAAMDAVIARFGRYADPDNLPAEAFPAIPAAEMPVVIRCLQRLVEHTLLAGMEQQAFDKFAWAVTKGSNSQELRKFVGKERFNVNGRWKVLVERCTEHMQKIKAIPTATNGAVASIEDASDDEELAAIKAAGKNKKKKSSKDKKKPAAAAMAVSNNPTDSAKWCKHCELPSHTSAECRYAKECRERGVLPVPYAERRAARGGGRGRGGRGRGGYAGRGGVAAVGQQPYGQEAAYPAGYPEPMQDDFSAAMYYHPN